MVSLLTLILPWAGCQFIRETESALREGQQQMLGGTAQAIADSLSQFPDEMLSGDGDGDRIYAHPLASAPLIDGYVDDWTIPDGALAVMRGVDGPIRYVLGQTGQHWYLYVEVRDDTIVYAGARDQATFDQAYLTSIDPSGRVTTIRFRAEAPGRILAVRHEGAQSFDETRIEAHWEDSPDGYRIEARIPRSLLAGRFGLSVYDAGDASSAGVTSNSFRGNAPGPVVTISPVLQSVATGYVQPGWRLMILDRQGWRIASVGSVNVSGTSASRAAGESGWLRLIYSLVLEPAAGVLLADPAPGGRETQAYISEALAGESATRWFRSRDTGRAVVSVARPVWSGTVQTGVIVLQQGTDAILSLTNQALTRLIVLTLVATIVVAAVLLGYASWLSIRIRQLSAAAEKALDSRRLQAALPSALAGDEVGDLSRSFSSVLRQLGNYNDYLKSLASKLSHELRTPLTIVRSSLENLEHEVLPQEALEYTARAREGTDRLQKILNAMSEANRIEELIGNADPEDFQLGDVLGPVASAYADAWPERRFEFRDLSHGANIHGAPELIVQMLDKLVDNAVDFTKPGDTIGISLDVDAGDVVVSVTNPGPPLPEEMREELFDSMVSVRDDKGSQHLGLGLYIARLIAEGHNGTIAAGNAAGGVRFSIRLPALDKG